MISVDDRPCKLAAGRGRPRQRCRSLVATLVAAYRSSALGLHTEGHRLPRARGPWITGYRATSLNHFLPRARSPARGVKPDRSATSPVAKLSLGVPKRCQVTALQRLGPRCARPQPPAPSYAMLGKRHSILVSGGTKPTGSCRCVRSAEAALPTCATLQDREPVACSYSHVCNPSLAHAREPNTAVKNGVGGQLRSLARAGAKAEARGGVCVMIYLLMPMPTPRTPISRPTSPPCLSSPERWR